MKTEKRCALCKTIKPLDKFSIVSKHKDGRSYTCIDLDRASMAHSKCLPDMLTVRGFCQLMDYLQTEDCYKRYGIQKQARCTRCHVPLEQCECQG